MNPAPPPEEIDATETAGLLAQDAIVLLDCREPDEYALCSIPGAKLLPLSVWGERFPNGFPDKDAAVVIHCHHGMRSLRATRWLRQQGYSNVRSMAGGIETWSLLVDPSVPRY